MDREAGAIEEGEAVTRSTTRWRKRYRCKRESCRYRFSVSVYRIIPVCPKCKGAARCIEQERANEQAKVRRCNCNVYPFPHAEGTLRMCLKHPLADVTPSDEEVFDYERLMSRPRGG